MPRQAATNAANNTITSATRRFERLTTKSMTVAPCRCQRGVAWVRRLHQSVKIAAPHVKPDPNTDDRMRSPRLTLPCWRQWSMVSGTVAAVVLP